MGVKWLMAALRHHYLKKAPGTLVPPQRLFKYVVIVHAPFARC